MAKRFSPLVIESDGHEGGVLVTLYSSVQSACLVL